MSDKLTLKSGTASFDLLPYLEKDGYTVQADDYIFEECTTADGTWHGTKVAEKRTITATVASGMSTASIKALAAFLSLSTFTVEYADPMQDGGVGSGTFRAASKSFPKRNSGIDEWSGFSLTLSEV